MIEKIAVKRLTKSDLTFFIWHFEHANAGNQKAINLNADVFVDKLFPDLPLESVRQGDRFSLDLAIYGPAGAGILNLQRKILKGAAYKNWRLDGEFVRDEPERFKPLHEGDIAVIEFVGDRYPSRARLVLLASGAPDDAAAHREFEVFLAGRSMATISSVELQEVLARANPKEEHPLRSISLSGEIQDAALGGLEATRRLLKKRATRSISKTELRNARDHADEIGAIGEEFVNDYLSVLLERGEIEAFVWVARQNAIAPFDFEVVRLDGITERVDVKSTSGPFEHTIHVSTNEIAHMADTAVPYRVYRVFEIQDGKAKLKVSEPLGVFAADLVGPLSSFPRGVQVDSIAFSPGLLTFAQTVDLEPGFKAAD